VVDHGEFLEVHEGYAQNIVVGFARLGGASIGIVASRPVPPARRRASAPHADPEDAAGHRAREMRAPMPGKILAVHAVAGDPIARGAVLIVLEAMKMENDLLAPADGRVKSVHVRSGAAVNTGDLLVVLE
jgi:biotin carboxyl carrier protein